MVQRKDKREINDYSAMGDSRDHNDEDILPEDDDLKF